MKASLDFFKEHFDWEEVDAVYDEAISEFVTP